MCSSGIMYLEDGEYTEYLNEEKETKFYNKDDDKWDYYSGLPNPRAYESN